MVEVSLHFRDDLTFGNSCVAQEIYNSLFHISHSMKSEFFSRKEDPGDIVCQSDCCMHPEEYGIVIGGSCPHMWHKVLHDQIVLLFLW